MTELHNICPTCGVKAPAPGESCVVCYTPAPAQVLPAPARIDATCWVCLWGQFTCRSCGFKSPINFLDADGKLECVHCGIDQAFDVSRWGLVLSLAHDVADYDGPSPERRAADPTLRLPPDLDTRNSLSRYPQFYTWVDQKSSGTSLLLEWCAAPGHPLCPGCRRPLDVELDRSQRMVTTCRTCGDRKVYDADAAVAGLYEPLVGAAADEHRADLPQAEEVDDPKSQVVALQCPLCRGPLAVADDDTVHVNCDHCGATVRLPRQTRGGHGSEAAGLVPFWLLFNGMSNARWKGEAAAQAIAASAELEEEQRRAYRKWKAEQERSQGAVPVSPATLGFGGNEQEQWRPKPWHARHPIAATFLAVVVALMFLAPFAFPLLLALLFN